MFSGATCDGSDANCPASVGICRRSWCKCKAGFFADGTNCVKNSFPDTCTTGAVCGDHGQCVGGSLCVCDLEFVVKDGKCVEGVEKIGMANNADGDAGGKDTRKDTTKAGQREASSDRSSSSAAPCITSCPWTLWSTAAIAVVLHLLF
nr:hypothetical protein BaRGS_030960 [Batillaria attramentaria]